VGQGPASNDARNEPLNSDRRGRCPEAAKVTANWEKYAAIVARKVAPRAAQEAKKAQRAMYYVRRRLAG
jgi:hypothetical protein